MNYGFQDDKLHGQGTLRWVSGYRYQGIFDEGQFPKTGQITAPDGTTRTVNWPTEYAFFGPEAETLAKFFSMLDAVAEEPALFSMAHDFLQITASLTLDDGEIVGHLGWAEYELEQYANAVQTLKRATTLTTDWRIDNHLAAALWRSGAQVEAQALWDDMVANNAEAAGAVETVMFEAKGAGETSLEDVVPKADLCDPRMGREACTL